MSTSFPPVPPPYGQYRRQAEVKELAARLAATGASVKMIAGRIRSFHPGLTLPQATELAAEAVAATPTSRITNPAKDPPCDTPPC